MIKAKKIIIFSTVTACLLISFFCNNTSYAQTEKGTDSDCIFCTQFVPECTEGEKLVPQTCKKCAHCEPIENNEQKIEDSKQKDLSTDITKPHQCIIHAQCPHWHKCIDGQCILRPHRRNPDVVIRKKPKKETKKIAKKSIAIPKKVKKEIMISKPSEDLTTCKNPCGAKCCKAGKKCITIDQCTGSKGKCKLPVLKFCSSKPPEKITGRLNPF